MGQTDDAKIKVGVEGIDEATAAAGKLTSSWQGAGAKIESGFKSLGASVGGGVQTMISDLGRVANVAQTISFADSITRAREFQNSVTRMAVAADANISSVGNAMEKLARKTGVPEARILEFSKSMGRLTYDAQGSAMAFEGLNQEAIATGRSAEDMTSLGATLKNVLGVSGDTKDALQSIRGQAEAFGNVGGAMALQDSLVSVSGMLGQIGGNLDGNRQKLTGFMAALQGDVADKAHGARAAQGIFGKLSGDPIGFARYLHKNVGDMYDKHGIMNDPVETALAVQRRAKKEFGGGEKGLRRFISTFGMEGGSELFNLSEDEIRAKFGAKSTVAADKEKKFKDSAAGEREQARTNAEINARKRGEAALPLADTVGKFAAEHPFLSSIGLGVGSQMLGAGAKSLITGAFGKAGAFFGGDAAAAAGAGGAGAGAGAGGLGVAGAGAIAASATLGGLAPLAFAAYGLHEIGQDRETMGKEWRARPEIDTTITSEKDMLEQKRASEAQAQAAAQEQEQREYQKRQLIEAGASPELAEKTVASMGGEAKIEIVVMTDGVPITAHAAYKRKHSTTQ